MKVFDWRTISVLISGYGYRPTPIEMWGEGQGVFHFARAKPGMTHKIGVDGRMTASKTADNSIESSVKLSQLSPTNAILSFMFNLQQMSGEAGFFLHFQDPMRQDVATTTVGYIESHTPIERGGEATETEWKFFFESGLGELGDPTFVGTPSDVAENLGVA